MIVGLGENLAERLEIFFNSGESVLVFGIREREAELLPIFFFTLFESLPCPFDGIAFTVEQPFDVQQELHVPFLVEPMLRRRFAGLEQFKFCLPVAEHVRLHPDDPAYLTDFEIDLVG